MPRKVLVVVALGAVVTLGGCGCGGAEGSLETSGLTGASIQAAGPDRSLIGPANAPVGGSSTEESAAVFTPAHAGTLTRIDLLLSQGATPGPVVIEVRPAAGNVPNPDPASALGSVQFDTALLPQGPGLVSLDLTPYQVAVGPGQGLAIVLRSGGGSAVWWQTSADQASFANAAVRARPAPGAPWGPWQASLGTDFSFQSWVSP